MFNPRSQPIIVENTREIVRLKAYDPYFSKIKKFLILRQSPLISTRIEEEHFFEIPETPENRNFYASSIATEIKGN